VTSGAGQSANVTGGSPVFGQTALVQTGTGHHTQYQSWFVGFRGNIAFTVLLASSSHDISASVLAGQFLNALQASS
jgi:hypothetical protein